MAIQKRFTSTEGGAHGAERKAHLIELQSRGKGIEMKKIM